MRHSTYDSARSAHDAWLALEGVTSQNGRTKILRQMDQILVATGPPIEAELGHLVGESVLYYDARADQLYSWSKFELGFSTDNTYSWRVQRLNVAQDGGLPVLQFYYDLYRNAALAA